MSVLQDLDKLNNLLATTEKKAADNERPTMPVPPAARLAFARLVPAKQIFEIAEKRMKVEQGIVNDEMITSYCEVLYTQGSRPTNPRLKVEKDGRPDMSGLFQVQEKWKLVYDKGDAPVKVRLVDALKKAGFTAEIADKIVENEVNYQPMTVLRPLNELAQGNAVERSAAAKVIALATGGALEPFTFEERQAAITKIEDVWVKDGILDRVKAYVKSAAELRNLFRVIQPVHFVSHMKYAESDTEEERTKRLADEARSLVIGTTKK
jgi:hypothetical protein